MSSELCLVMEDYLTNPYQPGMNANALPRTRSQSVTSRLQQSVVPTRNTPLRRSSFSPGSKLSLPKLSFRSRSSSVSSFSSSSSSASISSGSSEQFWNQYRRTLPRCSFAELLRKAVTKHSTHVEGEGDPHSET